MMRIGLTGGIGSGKTFVSSVFKSLGIEVFNADLKAHEAYLDPIIKSEVIALLGKQSYTDQTPNKNHIASMVFSNTELLSNLNKLIHPWVEREFNNWADNLSEQTFILKEAAILFESGSYQNLDAVICVHAPDKTRITRVMQRDNTTQEEVIKRMQNQWEQEKKMSRADYLIDNDGTKLVLPQVLEIQRRIRN